jgi:predicted MFS family arabinose efflux permease
MSRIAESSQTAASNEARRSVPSSIVWLLPVCCALSVANVYYAQPLLDAIAHDFEIAPAHIGGVITSTQIGCALALVFVVPLGDILDKKRLMSAQLVALSLACIGVAIASSRAGLLLSMAAAGLVGTAMTQGLIAYAATLAPDRERGRVVGAAQSGVVVGLLMARTFAGAVADFAGWRMVYWMSAAVAMGMLAVLWRQLPALPATPTSLRYGTLLRSMIILLREERVLRVRGTIGLLMFAALGTFWSALVLPLSAPPHAMSHTAIGAFGLVGAAGAIAATRAGRLADRGFGDLTTGVALVLLLAAWLPLLWTTRSIALLIVGILLLDAGGQAIHVVNQSMILGARPEARARLVGCYMLFYSAGVGLGSIASTAAYAYAGWSGVCLLGATTSAAAMVFWWATRRNPNAAPRAGAADREPERDTVCEATR